MKKIKVLHSSNLPTKIPIPSTILYLLALDYYQFSDIVKGIVYAYIAIIWIFVIIRLITRDAVDIFKESDRVKETTSSFVNKLNDLKKISRYK